jgi:hypothetical protein
MIFILSGGKYKTSSSGYQNVGKHMRAPIHMKKKLEDGEKGGLKALKPNHTRL